MKIVDLLNSQLESTTRTSKQGAPGTLKAKIAGKVTCAKVNALKKRAKATPHDKAQANWFINMHGCNEQEIQEIFDQPAAKDVNWRKYPYDMWETNFNYQGTNVVVEMNSDVNQDQARFVFHQNYLDLPSDYQGWNVIFRVGKQTDVTGKFGTHSVGLIARVLQIIQSFLKQHPWDYVVFSGQQGSRNKLYQAMSVRFAQKHNLELVTSYDDFVVHKPYQKLDEAFDWKLPKRDWQVVEQGDHWLEINFQVEGHPYNMELMAQRQQRDDLSAIYDVVFISKKSADPIDIIGAGNAFKVFSAVKQLLDYARSVQTKVKISGFFFTAKEPSRQKLYTQLAPRLAQAYDWEYTGDPRKFPYKPNPKFEQGYLVYDPQEIQETAGVGLVVPGVNMPVGMHRDEIQRQARKLGFRVNKNGVPPLIYPAQNNR